MADDKIVTIPLSKLAGELAEKSDMSKKAVNELLGAFIDLTVKHLKKGNKVRMTGFGIFQVRKRPARMGRNPATGEQIKIKASKKLAFRAEGSEGSDLVLRTLLDVPGPVPVAGSFRFDEFFSPWGPIAGPRSDR